MLIYCLFYLISLTRAAEMTSAPTLIPTEISLWTVDQRNLQQVTDEFPTQYLPLFQRNQMNLVACFDKFVEKMSVVSVIGAPAHVLAFLNDLLYYGSEGRKLISGVDITPYPMAESLLLVLFVDSSHLEGLTQLLSRASLAISNKDERAFAFKPLIAATRDHWLMSVKQPDSKSHSIGCYFKHALPLLFLNPLFYRYGCTVAITSLNRDLNEQSDASLLRFTLPVDPRGFFDPEILKQLFGLLADHAVGLQMMIVRPSAYIGHLDLSLMVSVKTAESVRKLVNLWLEAHNSRMAKVQVIPEVVEPSMASSSSSSSSSSAAEYTWQPGDVYCEAPEDTSGLEIGSYYIIEDQYCLFDGKKFIIAEKPTEDKMEVETKKPAQAQDPAPVEKVEEVTKVTVQVKAPVEEVPAVQKKGPVMVDFSELEVQSEVSTPIITYQPDSNHWMFGVYNFLSDANGFAFDEKFTIMPPTLLDTTMATPEVKRLHVNTQDNQLLFGSIHQAYHDILHSIEISSVSIKVSFKAHMSDYWKFFNRMRKEQGKEGCPEAILMHRSKSEYRIIFIHRHTPADLLIKWVGLPCNKDERFTLVDIIHTKF